MSFDVVLNMFLILDWMLAGEPLPLQCELDCRCLGWSDMKLCAYWHSSLRKPPRCVGLRPQCEGRISLEKEKEKKVRCPTNLESRPTSQRNCLGVLAVIKLFSSSSSSHFDFTLSPHIHTVTAITLEFLTVLVSATRPSWHLTALLF